MISIKKGDQIKLHPKRRTENPTEEVQFFMRIALSQYQSALSWDRDLVQSVIFH